MPALTDEDKVIRNDVGKRIAAAIESLSAPEAEKVSYDNTESGMTADNTQDAIDELKSDIDSVKLEDLDDVNLTSPQDEDELHYDSATSKWKNIAKKIYEKSASGSLVSFNDGGDNIPLKSLIANITAVQSGSGTPSPSNIRAISGWSGINVSRAGKNLLNPKDNFPLTGTLSSEYYYQIQPNVAGTGKIGFYHLKLGKTYTFSCNITTDVVPFTVSIGAGNGNYLTDVASVNVSSGSSRISVTFTVTADKLVNGDIFCFRAPRYGSQTNTNFTISDIMLELSDTATIYEPYNETTLTLPFGQTVYGGTLDVLSGVLTVTYGLFVPTNSMTIAGLARNTHNCWCFTIFESSTIFKNGGNVLSNINIPDTWQASLVSGFCKAVTQGKAIFALSDSDSGLDSTATQAQVQTAFQNFVSTYSPQAVYELTTPTTIQLTPAQVKTLLGQNNIFADTGDISLSYFTQNANAINDIAESNTRTALNTDVPKTDLTDIFVTGTKNNTGATISAGTYFYVNGQLALCKSAISANADLTLNTNYELVTAGIMSDVATLLNLSRDTKTASTRADLMSWFVTKCGEMPDGSVCIVTINPNYSGDGFLGGTGLQPAIIFRSSSTVFRVAFPIICGQAYYHSNEWHYSKATMTNVTPT